MRVVRLRRVKRIAEAAAAQLAKRLGSGEPITAEELIQLLARIARTGPPAVRLRAIELLGTRMGLFREAAAEPALSDEERARYINVILDRLRRRREEEQGDGPVPAPEEGN